MWFRVEGSEVRELGVDITELSHEADILAMTQTSPSAPNPSIDPSFDEWP